MGWRIHYRKDIDGLRGLAVLLVVLVVLGHARIAGFDGGFLGVDIFFVISGYLITGIILEELRTGRFSLIGFYERRVRRIFPALIAVLLASAAMAWIYLLPTDLLSFGQSMAAAMLSVSNFYFNAQLSYFAAAATLLPLLHTWSLGVEEQFYVLFPLLLMLQARFLPSRKWLWGLIIVLAALSFAFSVYSVSVPLRGSFYWTHSRAWELLVGSVLAMGMLPALRNALLRNGLAVLGAALIAYAMIRYEKTVLFPGFAALLPVLGAAFIIHAGKDGLKTLVGQALSLRPLVGIGLISYSLYLWHWPIMAFYRYISLIDEKPFTLTEQWGLVAVSFGVAVISWKCIEQSFRTAQGKQRFPRARLFRIAAVAAIGVLVIAAALWVGQGVPSRFSADQVRTVSYLRQNEFSMGDRCFLRGNPSTWKKNVGNLPDCMAPDTKKSQHFLLLGDSHAGHIAAALKEGFPALDVAYAASAACFLYLSDAAADQGCKEYRQYFFEKHLPRRLGQTVILYINWERYFGLDGEQVLPRLAQTLERIRASGSDVILFGQTPVYNADVPKLLAMEARALAPATHYMDRERVLGAETRLRAFAEEHGVRYISLYDLLCPGGACPLQAADGTPLYTDRDHMTHEGAVMLMELLKESKQFL